MSNPPTVLLDVQPATGAHGARGIGRYVRGLTTAVDALDHDLRARIWAYGPASQALEAFEDRGIVVPRLLRPHRIPAWLSGRASSSWAVGRSRATVLHVTDPHRPWVSRTRASLVTVYDLIPLHEPEILASLRPDHRWMYGRYLAQIRAATRLIAISRTTAEDLSVRLGIPPDRIDVVYPVVSAPPVVPRMPAVEPTFLVVGALDPHKRPELALASFARLRARLGVGRLRFVGPGSRDETVRLWAAVDRWRLRGAVSIEGRIPDASLEEAYRTATALVSTSRLEGFGLPPVEAALRGTPVVAVDTDVARETVGEAAMLVPADAEAIAGAMESIRPVPDDVVRFMTRRFSATTAADALGPCYRLLLD